MGADQRSEPLAEVAFCLARGRQAGAAAQLSAVQRITERGRRGQVDQRIGVRAGDRRARWGLGGTAIMQSVGYIAHDHLGPFRAVARVDRGEPSQPLGQSFAKGIEYPVKLRLDGILACRHRCDELVSQFGDGLLGQRTDEPLTAAEMVQDQRMRNSRGSRDILQPESLGSGGRNQLLRRPQDQLSGLFRCAALPFASRRDFY